LLRCVELNGVGAGGDASALAGPVGVEELAARLVDALVGVRAEVVALRLQEVGGQAFAAESVEEGKRSGERGHRYSGRYGLRHHAAPGRLASFYHAGEVGIEQQIAERRITIEGFFDLAQ